MIRALAAALACAAALAGCDSAPRTPFKGIDVTGAALGGELRLTDHNGKPRTMADFRGKVVAITFGYTQCPDVCPTTLSDWNKALKLLGQDAGRVQMLFVTVDPQRDKPELLKEYVPAFNPGFLGLYGTEAQTKKVEDDFKIYAQQKATTPGQYIMEHDARTYVFDANGKVRLVEAPGTNPEAIASDLRLLLNSA
ncbi:MAG TPA: SCO family protein [Usitatibacter sp.]|nr:SCO family protein [Usitatibacter sp.]